MTGPGTFTVGAPVKGGRAERIAAARRQRPESAVWLALLELAAGTAESAPWTELHVRLPEGRAPDAPALQDAIVAVPARQARRFVRALVKAAARNGAPTLGRLRGRSLDPLAFLAAAASDDADALDAMAHAADADPAELRALAGFAATPVLLAARPAADVRLPAGWTGGHCPACGAWPTLAELRGLERKRWLRCGRCAADWQRPALTCAFCGETDHHAQASLSTDDERSRVHVDTCRSCHGYLKTFNTLAALPTWALALDDLETIELDLAAGDRGFRRPEPRQPAAIRVVDDAGLGGYAGGWA